MTKRLWGMSRTGAWARAGRVAAGLALAAALMLISSATLPERAFAGDYGTSADANGGRLVRMGLNKSIVIKLPTEARRMYPNQGIEGLAVVQAGPLRGWVVGFAERLTRGSGYHTGWIWTRGEPQAIHLRDIDGFNITDAAGLPDGGLMVLERHFRWAEGIKMRLRRILPGELRPGARLDGHTLLEADSAYDIDNMEGLAVHRGPRGETVVSLISDDNFNRFLQRTVLLQFTLVDDTISAARPRRA